MGITESKLLATHVLQACKKAEREGKRNIDPSCLWVSKDIETIAISTFRKIPSRIRGRGNKVDNAAQNNEPIVLPGDLLPFLEHWKNIPQKFQASLPPSHNYEQALSVNAADDFVARSFLFLCDIETTLTVERVRCRLCYVAFYLMKDQIQYQGFSHDALVFLSSMIKRAGIVSIDEMAIQEKLRSWVEKGERFWLLSMDLEGPGVLFLLPQDIGEYM
ncbi:hypothetical protein MW887_009929 [Aspergillus wentii]|nr:hypothetical protein MW887_009929 [Aspergillus wentii]